MRNAVDPDRPRLRRNRPLRAGEVERIVWIDPQGHRVVRGAEIVAVLFVPVFAVAEGDVLRQVVVQRAEPIVDPRAEIRKVAVVLVPARMELRLSAVVAVGRPQRADDRQPIDLPGEPREPIAHFDAALPMLLEADLERVERVALVAVAVGHDQPLDGEPLGILHVGEGRLGDRLAGVLGQHWLGIEALHVAHAAIHEEPDHALRLGSEMGPPVGRRPASFPRHSVAIEHRAESQGAESGEERSPRAGEGVEHGQALVSEGKRSRCD
jgi:hypothetical protein